MADMRVESHGSVAVVVMLTPAARAWVDENLELEGWQMFGASRFAVEPRLVQDIALGAVGDGLTVEA